MLITASRPNFGTYAATLAACKTSTEGTADVYSTSTETRLSEVAAMAALAQAAKLSKPKAELPEDLAAAVTAELGESGITTFEDQRVEQLTGYLLEGWESPSNDFASILGEGWTEQKREASPLSAPVTFTREGENVIQHITFDKTQGTTALHTIHAESFIRTRHHEMVRDQAGKVVVSDEIVH